MEVVDEGDPRTVPVTHTTSAHSSSTTRSSSAIPWTPMQALKSLVAHLGKTILTTHDLAQVRSEQGPAGGEGSAVPGRHADAAAEHNPLRYRSQYARHCASRAALRVPALREQVASGRSLMVLVVDFGFEDDDSADMGGNVMDTDAGGGAGGAPSISTGAYVSLFEHVPHPTAAVQRMRE
eukprot:CAMPEP_0205929328 /NCGR_PEP_ID=MMETSP1325-20131115/25247_1 /ASSEMBLY_ACC=CAM_ASM_000708 /TAXON_ID=236786 /ORGANISM="Florenciella sp., Strain RCC1007" /LENGTH=179 /DNA_ID=CAMNT_0053298527 /DNA_START=75 /DNA_END=611 /DNA_ORIENTATION=+